MKSKVIKVLIAVGLVLNIGVTAFAGEKIDSAKTKVEQAVQNRTFYNYMMAYIDILNLPQDQQGELLNQLAPVFNDANTSNVQKARTMLESVAKNKDGKTYAETEAFLSGLSNSDMDAFTKGYLLGELTSWGKQFVFTEDYTKAVDALMEIGKYKDFYTYRKAVVAINNVANSESKAYLLNEAENAKKTNNIDIKKIDVNAGTILFTNGDQYIGAIKNNLPNGKGDYTCYDQYAYVGEFKDGVLNGKGQIFYSDEILGVEGEFKDGLLNGTAKVNDADGKLAYEGSYVNDKLNGNGKSYYPNGTVEYDGQWKNGEPDGQGTMALDNGDKYVGSFTDGKYNGQGTYTWKNGSKYVGEYKDGKKNGQGTYTYADGSKYVGQFVDGEGNGYGTFVDTDGSKYEGQFKDGKPDGQGTYIYANGEKYVGQFMNGKRNGEGTYTWTDGDVYTGHFVNGYRSGQGTYTWADGKVQQGTWQNDEYIGK